MIDSSCAFFGIFPVEDAVADVLHNTDSGCCELPSQQRGRQRVFNRRKEIQIKKYYEIMSVINSSGSGERVKLS